MTMPVVVAVSHATRASGSSVRIASRIASEIWSHILSGCPSVTDSDVNRYCGSSRQLVIVLMATGPASSFGGRGTRYGRSDRRVARHPGRYPASEGSGSVLPGAHIGGLLGGERIEHDPHR